MKKTSVIIAKIRRLNLNSESTTLFYELEEVKRKFVEKSIEFIYEEEPIFCFFFKTDYWWVITNFRIIVSENYSISYHFFEEVKSIHLKDIFENEIIKEECENIEIKLENGDEVKLNVEKKTWHSVYNLVKFLISS